MLVALVLVRAPTDRLGVLAVLGRELVAAQQFGDEAPPPIACVRRLRLRVAVDGERVGDALDAQVQVERVVVRVIRLDAPVAEAAIHRAFERRVVGDFSVGRDFDVADQPVVNLGRLDVRAGIRRLDLDRGLVLPRVVDDLTRERRQAVDGEARATFALALRQHGVRPLLAQARELDVLQRPLAVIGLGVRGELESLFRVVEDVLVRH